MKTFHLQWNCRSGILQSHSTRVELHKHITPKAELRKLGEYTSLCRIAETELSDVISLEWNCGKGTSQTNFLFSGVAEGELHKHIIRKESCGSGTL